MGGRRAGPQGPRVEGGEPCRDPSGGDGCSYARRETACGGPQQGNRQEGTAAPAGQKDEGSFPSALPSGPPQTSRKEEEPRESESCSLQTAGLRPGPPEPGSRENWRKCLNRRALEFSNGSALGF